MDGFDPCTQAAVLLMGIVLTAWAMNRYHGEDDNKKPTLLQKPFVERPQQDRPGFVYLIRDVEISGFCKIGRTLRPHQRLDLFSVKLPFRIEVLAMIQTDDYVALEADLQEYFNHRHARGEWFALTDQDIAAIQSLAD